MIIRIVKMQFHPENIPVFQALFKERKDQISAMPGCEHVELWQECSAGNIFFTYSRWVSEEALEAYRSSDFFKDTWKQTKALFSEKAAAWSLVQS